MSRATIRATAMAAILLMAPEAARATRNWVDVGLHPGVEEVGFEASSGATVRNVTGLPQLPAGRAFVARASRGRLLLQPAGGEIGVHEAGDTVYVTPSGADARIRINGKEYRGALKLFRSPSGRVTAVNRVAIEEYLRGVLPHEIGRLQPETMEAGKAQAVAARTYTVSYLGRRAREGFDVYATVEDQLYGGVSDEGPLTDRCVQETAGLVALYGGVPIRANYFSTCGGITANIEDVWPEPALPWLRSVPDRPYEGADDYCTISPQHRWSDVWEVQEFLDIFNKTYPQFIQPTNRRSRELRDVRVDSRSPSGRVARMVVVTDAGEFAMYGDLVRRVLVRPKRSRGAGGPGAILRSAFFKIGVARDTRGRPFAVVASGAGYGHGVGMCQMGALAMSRRGKNFREILTHYYQGIEVRQP